MRIPFLQKPVAPSTLYMNKPEKYSIYKNGKRPAGFQEMLKRDGPDAVIARWGTFDPYLRADIEREQAEIEKRKREEVTFLALRPTTGLTRRGAKLGDGRWTHMNRCDTCDYDNLCLETPGTYPCTMYFIGRPCPGHFPVSERDAARVRNMRPEQRIPYSSIADRYDHKMLKETNKARARSVNDKPPADKPTGKKSKIGKKV